MFENDWIMKSHFKYVFGKKLCQSRCNKTTKHGTNTTYAECVIFLHILYSFFRQYRREIGLKKFLKSLKFNLSCENIF